METKTVQTAEGRVAYHEYGPAGGQVVVGVPGIGDTRHTWRFLGPILAERGYRFIAMDLRGHGESDAGFSSYLTSDIGNDVVALLEQLDIRDAVLIGNSMGGGAVAWASLGAADRVQRLVLVNPFVRDMPNSRWMRLLLPILFFWLWGVWVWGMYRKTLFKNLPGDFDENQADVMANMREQGRLYALRAMAMAGKSDIGDRVGQVDTPTLVVMGSEDPDYPDPAAEGETLRGLLGGPVEVKMIDEAGHYPQAEKPEVFASVVLAYLEPEVTGRTVGT